MKSASVDNLRGLRVGRVKEFFAEGTHPKVKAKVMDGCSQLEALGAEVGEISIDSLPHSLAVYYIIAMAEASSNLSRYDGVRYGRSLEKGTADWNAAFARTRSEGFGEEVKRRILLGTLRPLGGILRGVLREGAEGEGAPRPGIREGVQEVRRPPRANDARAPPKGRREGHAARGLPHRHQHGRGKPHRLAGDQHPLRLRRRPPRRDAAHRPQVPGGRPPQGGQQLRERGGVQEPAASGGCERVQSESSLRVKIGLEVHCQLTALKTKLFCSCSSDYRASEPNEKVCPVCFGLPGTLPVLNAKAVEYATMIGLALNCEVANRSIFYRKNYFYPDLPKGFQISQYDKAGGVPIASSGFVEVEGKRVQDNEDPARGGPGQAHLRRDDRQVELQPRGLQQGGDRPRRDCHGAGHRRREGGQGLPGEAPLDHRVARRLRTASWTGR